MIVNANSTLQHVIQIKNGMIKHVNVNEKITLSAKKIIVGVLAHVFLTIESTENVLLINQSFHVMKIYLLWILYQQK